METTDFSTNIPGLVRQVQNKLSASNYLYPIFEALVNSIQACQGSNHNISIEIERGDIQLTSDNSKPKDSNIVGFKITDNGDGFNESNFKSFKELYTEHKLSLGCKGVGRFVALAVFSKMEVSSTFKSEVDGLMYHREFTFTDKGFQGKPKLELTTTSDLKTEIRFSGINKKYLKNTSTGDIASQILRHVLIYFVTSNAPKISVYDLNTTTMYDLQNLFDSNISVDDDIENITYKGEKFELFFLKMRFKNFHKHQIHYCGSNREVTDEVISNLIPDFLNERIPEGETSSYYLAVYVIGDYLNKHVDDTRNEFTFPKKKPENEIFDIISFEELEAEVANVIASRYNFLLEKNVTAKMDNAKTYIYTEAPEYAHLLEHPDLLKNIKPNSNADDLEAALHKVNFDFAKKQRARVNEFLNGKPDQIQNITEYKEHLQEILTNQNDIGKSNLVKYMHHRKAILKLFEKFLEIQNDNKYKLEADIHDILFERKKTGNELSFAQHNLWLLDERLAYSDYLSSDLPVGDTLKPDILIYNHKFIYGNPKESIVIFELKRPGRVEYKTTEKDLGTQLMLQVLDIINSGGGKTHATQRNLNITETTPKFGFVIADLDNDQQKHHKLMGYKPTPKGTLFKYEEGVNMYIEILTYDQLKEDANLRHAAFFKMLGIDNI